MSFHNKDFWMPRTQLNIDENSQISHTNASKTDPKRTHNWFIDGNESESFPYKKQAVEIPHPNSYTALLNSNIYSENTSNFQFNERLLEIDSTFGGFSYSGIRKVKVNNIGEDNIISFGEVADDISGSGRVVCNFDFLMGQSSGQRSEEKGLSESTSDAVINGVQESAVLKKKGEKITKKIPQNNFPSNVRSLLSTGMLDGVPVKYVAWSREKELHGVIKGASYLCGCKSCTFSKAINAYEFERHAGCKTKHPNNHIYFENGKTIYGVVQELRNTPQNVLFEVIQTITGSQINQKSFRIWKESFLAATRELQRIYGKEEGIVS